MRPGRSISSSICAFVAIASLVASATRTGAVAPVRHPAAVTRVVIPDTAYPIPAGALFVAPSGDDANDGSQQSPFLTVTHAITVAPSGGTIVLRAGIYREALPDVTQPVTIQPYPHEQAWLSGSDVVTGWVPVTGGWVHHGWTAQFCHSCWAQGAIDPQYPLAGWPDQVFFDGAPLTQVADLAHLTTGTFFVDYPNTDLYVGSDPNAVSLVEATARVKAVEFESGAAGSTVRGIGIMQYGPNWNENTTGEIRDFAPNMGFDHDAFTQSANRGLFANGAAHVTVVDSLFVHNGFTGVYVRSGDYFDLERNVIDDNNTEKFFDGFSPAAGAGGAKISASYHVTAKGNVATNNWGNGIWFDVSSYDITLVDNFASHNDRNGLYVEISEQSVIASNLSTLNGQAGLKLSGATHARVYNNTFADNLTYQASVHDDGRDQPDPAKLALGITWDTANNTVVNNILAAPQAGSVGPLLYTENTEHPVVVDAATMITGMDDDLFTRPTATQPALLATWIHPAPTATSQYPSLASFQTGTGYEANGAEVNGYTTSPIFVAPAQGDYTQLSGGPADGTGVPLPSDIAAMIGVTAGVTVDRGALVYPGSAPLVTTYASDDFSRVVSNGWGSAPVGGAWTVKPATATWAVNGSVGTVTVLNGKTVVASIAPLTTTDADLAISFTSDAGVSARPKFSFAVRAVDSTHQYQARVRVAPSGATRVAMTRVSGTTHALVGSEVTLPGTTWTPGTVFRVRTEAVGVGPTTLRVKVWLASAAEPAAWNVATSDNDPALQAAGSFGVLAVTPAGASGTTSTFTFDDLLVTTT
jgi:parallel beta-helix repeat protein